jgi:hypothetical protein
VSGRGAPLAPRTRRDHSCAALADPYLIELLDPRGYGGPLTLQQYQDMYYGGMFNHTRQASGAPWDGQRRRSPLHLARASTPRAHAQVNGDHALIWSRPVDSYPIFLNLSAFLTFSPHYVMFSG